MVSKEPVRGNLPEPWFGGLTGIEQARALSRGLVPLPPLGHLMGVRVSGVGPGTAVCRMPASPWFRDAAALIHVDVVAETAMTVAALTGAPAGVAIRIGTFALNYLRPATLGGESFIAKARVLHAGRAFTFIEAIVEDAQGREVARANGSALAQPIDPPPPDAPALDDLEPVEAPVYPTPDPYDRPAPRDVFPFRIWDELDGSTILSQLETYPPIPQSTLLGLDRSAWKSGAGTGVQDMPATGWLCFLRPVVSPGVIATVATVTQGGAVLTVSPPGHRVGVIDQSTTFLREIAPDGRNLRFEARIDERSDDLLFASLRVLDAHGDLIALGRQTAMLVPNRRSGSRRAERRLMTALFTDIVGSTAHAKRRGDRAWTELLEEHHDLVRRELRRHGGREVKTTGDGFLAVFESPTDAARCARAIRDGVRELGLSIRAGVHTGEFELTGRDVAGIAVHVASRVMDVAGPDEVLVTATVRDLVDGSDLTFDDRDVHTLEGTGADRRLFAVLGSTPPPSGS